MGDMLARELAAKVLRNIPSVVSVATRTAIGYQDLYNVGSYGSHTSATYRWMHVATTNASDIRLVYGNFYSPVGSGDTVGPNNIQVKATLEYNGNYYEVLFGGQTTVTVNPGGIVVSDPVNIYIPKGTVYYTRTLVTVTTGGQQWPVGLTLYNTTAGSPPANYSGEWVAYDADFTTSNPTSGQYTWGQYGFSPLAIVGTPQSYKSTPSLLVVGDSETMGGGDSPNDNGWILRALNTNYGYLMVGRGGQNASVVVGTMRRFRFALAKYATHAFVELGTNDFGGATPTHTFTQVQGYLTDIYTELVNRGIKVYGVTIPPRTNSSDSWATANNQTAINTAYQAGGYRDQLNSWIKAGGGGLLSGYIDCASVLSTTNASGDPVWIPGYTSDGIHPNPTGHAAIASALGSQITSALNM